MMSPQETIDQLLFSKLATAGELLEALVADLSGAYRWVRRAVLGALREATAGMAKQREQAQEREGAGEGLEEEDTQALSAHMRFRQI